MPTINQLVKNGRTQQYRKPKHPAMDACPQKRGVCLQVKIMDAEEAELGPSEGGFRVRPVARRRSDGVHSRRRPQPAGALDRARPRRGASAICRGVRYHIVRGVLDTQGVADPQASSL